MESVVSSEIFIPLIIIAITQMLKMAFPAIHGWLTIFIAIVVGVVIALTDNLIGVADVSIALGVVYALGAVGISVAANKAGGGDRGD